MNILFSCIGRRGYISNYFRPHLQKSDRIIGTGNSQLTSGFRACDLAILLPNILSTDYIPRLIEVCKQQKIDALLSFSDPDIAIISQYLDEFRNIGVVPIIPSPEVNNICFDKYQTYVFLKENGFETPETYIDLAEAIQAIKKNKLSFPLMVKPRHGSASRDLFKARNFQELDTFFHYAPDMLIQEMVVADEYGLDICNDLEGQVLSVVPRRKIAMRAGETDQAESCAHPILINLGLRLGNVLRHVGPLDVDLFLQGDRAFILELNPRFGGGYPTSHLAGADFPKLIIKMIKGEIITPQIGQFQSGVLMMKQYDIIRWDNNIVVEPDIKSLANYSNK